MQTLHGMLEREIWKQLPIIPDGLPSIRAALDDPSVLAAFPFDTSNFGEWVAHSNPWHMQAYGEIRPLRPVAECDELCCNRPIVGIALLDQPPSVIICAVTGLFVLGKAEHNSLAVVAPSRVPASRSANEPMVRSAEDEEEEGTPKDGSSSTSAEVKQPGGTVLADQTSASAAVTDVHAHVNGSSQRSGSQSATQSIGACMHQGSLLVQVQSGHETHTQWLPLIQTD